MKSGDCDILIVPGLGDSGPDHWQTRWESRLSTARRVVQDDWNAPDRTRWARRIADVVAAARRPVVLVAHSLGCVAVAHAAAAFPPLAVKGAFLVAPADTERDDMPAAVSRSFAAVPREPLPFPSMLVASRNDPYCDFARADDIAADWGSLLVDAGEAGHINAASGHGPWPEGLTRFVTLLARL